MTPIIAFRGVGKRFPGVVALDHVSFDLRQGECHAICGENGAGKSTLMKLLSGVITEHEGEILIRGKGPPDERLPLPVDVGDAVADYLAHARPADAMHSEVFCALSAP